jgi:hypothetical protein
LECYILNLEIREIVIKDKPRTLKKFKAVDLISNKFINAEIWNLENIINNNDKCLIKYALFQLGNIDFATFFCRIFKIKQGIII